MWWLIVIIPAIQEAEMGRIMVQYQTGQKSLQDPILTIKLGMVVCACDVIVVQAIPAKNVRP
jgi:hypothetical protein